MRPAAQYPTHQGYYPQPYQFYYTATGRYCAYDPSTGTHFIHSLKNNRWCLYYPDRVSPTQRYSEPKSRRRNASTEYQQYENEYQHGYGQYKSGERGREHVRRNRGEEMLYSAAATEAAHRSLIEESNIDMDYYFEDEGVDVRMGERSGRSRGPVKESRRHRSRSVRNQKAYTREASRPRERSMPHTNHHTHQCHHGCVHPKQTHGHHFGSNQAGVGYEGSDHDSGYMEDFEPIPEPRKSMPGVARWLDNTSSEFPMNDSRHPFDTEHTARDGTSYIHHSEVRVKHHSQKPHHTEKLTRDHSHQRSRSPSKRLHRQDSGIDMSMADLDIEIDIHMDDAPRQRYTSPSPSRSSNLNGSSQANAQYCGIDDAVEYYYTIPPCPNLPIEPRGEMVLVSRSQELAAPRSIHPEASPIFRQADSVYTPSVAAPRPSHPFHEAYNSPSMLPRAPSPPLSPPPHRTRRTGLGVPVVERERRYPRWD